MPQTIVADPAGPGEELPAAVDERIRMLLEHVTSWREVDLEIVRDGRGRSRVLLFLVDPPADGAAEQRRLVAEIPYDIDAFMAELAAFPQAGGG